MAKWQTLKRQADSLQTDAEELYAQADLAQCPQLVRVLAINDSWGHHDTRCERDAEHTGVHHVS